MGTRERKWYDKKVVTRTERGEEVYGRRYRVDALRYQYISGEKKRPLGRGERGEKEERREKEDDHAVVLSMNRPIWRKEKCKRTISSLGLIRLEFDTSFP